MERKQIVYKPHENFARVITLVAFVIFLIFHASSRICEGWNAGNMSYTDCSIPGAHLVTNFFFAMSFGPIIFAPFVLIPLAVITLRAEWRNIADNTSLYSPLSITKDILFRLLPPAVVIFANTFFFVL